MTSTNPNGCPTCSRPLQTEHGVEEAGGRSVRHCLHCSWTDFEDVQADHLRGLASAAMVTTAVE